MTWNDSRFNWEQQREIPNVYNISTDLESRHTHTHRYTQLKPTTTTTSSTIIIIHFFPR